MPDDANQGLPSQRPQGGDQEGTPKEPEVKPPSNKPTETPSEPEKPSDSTQETPEPAQASEDQKAPVEPESPSDNPSETSDKPTEPPAEAPKQEQPAIKRFDDTGKTPEKKETPSPAEKAPSEEPPKVEVKRPDIEKKAEAVKPEAAKAPAPEEKKKEVLKEGEKKVKKPIKRGNAILGIVIIFLVLFVLGMILLVLMLAQNPESNPLLELFGIEPTSLKAILSGIVNGVFGFLAFISLIFTSVGVFRVWMAPKGDKMAKRKAGIMSAIGFILTVIVIFVWVILYFYISQLQVGIRVYRGIITDPPEVTQLTAPIQVVFSAASIRERYRTSTIIAYNWDFNGDGKFDDGSGEEIAYTFEDKGENNGIFDVGVEAIFQKGKPVVVTKQVTISNILPEPAFKVIPGLEGFTPFEVTFDASEVKDPDGSIVKYEWDFDDDARYDAEGAKVTHTFEEAGTFPVLLQVMDNNGATATHTETLVIEKSEKAEIIIDADPGLEGEAPLEITFDGSRSTMPRTRISSYKWSFGDGSRDQKGRTVKHTYEYEGEYTVALEITGENGKKESSVVKVLIGAERTKPVAVITTDPETVDGLIEGDIPLTISFSASESTDEDENIIEYQWSFEDENTVDAYGETVEHTFTEAKGYTVTLKVIDADDNVGEATVDVSTEEPGLVAKVVANPTSGTLPLDVTFDASGSFVTDDSEIVAYRYDFGDGTPEISGSSRQTHRFMEEGTFVSLITVVTNDGGEETLEVYINVLAVPLQSKFDYNPKTGSAPLKVFFNADESTGDITTYSWDFGDGAISRVKNPEHTYEESGTYTVELEVQDISQNISTFTRNVIVE
jgi:PKD repeat protein